jgi:tRNA-splicing ligase RtcB (3'-phosphate/5'-hydroxy nucleic acid ligase)
MSNFKVIDAGDGKFVKAWTEGVQLEPQAEEQLRRVAHMKCVQPYPAVMPDGHLGIGCTVGAVIPTYRAVIPAVVGVDIGCGMQAIRTSLKASDLPDNLSALRSMIERAVPVGKPQRNKRNDGTWHNPPERCLEAWRQLEFDYAGIVNFHPKAGHDRPLNQLGTLGSGNHFIELCLDQDNQDVWVMLHSGSRGPGNRIGQYFIERAKLLMERYGIQLQDADLAFLPEGEQDFESYVRAVDWAQRYAQANRDCMMEAILGAIEKFFSDRELFVTSETVDCHHNYIEREHHFGRNLWIARKGAVRARAGELGIIPGSMGTRSYIVRGKGNADSFQSCSHGAGRQMSRAEARRRFTVEDHIKATAGVECRKDEGVIDETPAAYKSIDAVMEAQRDLVDVVHELKAVLCVKG